MTSRDPGFSVVTGPTVRRIVEDNLAGCVDVVRRAYLDHAAGVTVNPESTFVRFPDRPNSRIIALPAQLAAPWSVSGIKWVASYPDNIQVGLPRASAVLILNRADTGYPFACLEGSVISAARTAASAVLAAEVLYSSKRHVATLGIIGCGFIAGYVYRFLVGTGWTIEHVRVYDTDSARAEAFVARECVPGQHASVGVCPDLASALSGADLALFTTVAGHPHVRNPQLLARCPVVLHLSLRDLAPELVLGATNIVDDVDHVMRADTSLYLAEQLVGHRSFVSGTLADVMSGRYAVDHDKAVIFSPFGLGMLDVALGQWIYGLALAKAETLQVPNFFFAAETADGGGGGANPLNHTERWDS